jgi:ferritin-like metal-binding protein YciE
MELAAYELIGALAEQAGDQETAAMARAIAGEEQEMAERLAAGFDIAVQASLRDLSPDDISAQLNRYLEDAHAIEMQSLQLLERSRGMAGHPELAQAFEEHLAQTREHERLVRERLDERGASPSRIKDAALRLGALNWGMFFAAQPDTPIKLAGFAFAVEHLEIAAYELLRRVAERAGDAQSVAMAQRILAEERHAAAQVREQFDAALRAGLREQDLASR